MNDLDDLKQRLDEGGLSRRDFLRKGMAAGFSLTALGAVLAAMDSSAFAAGSGSALVSNGKPLVGFLLRAKTQARWSFDAAGFVAEAKALRMPYIVEFLPQDSGEQQQVAASAMIERGIKVLVFVPIDDVSSDTIVRTAERLGVKAVAYDATPGAGVNYAFQVQRNNIGVGANMARAALKYAPHGNFVIAAGDQATNVALLKMEGIQKVLDPVVKRGDVKVVSSIYNQNWSPAKAQVQVEGAIVKTKGDIQAVLAMNDGMALGAFSALKAAHLEHKTFVTGEDADLAHVQLIAEGYPGMSVFTPVVKMGKLAARVASDLLKGTLPKAQAYVKSGAFKVPAVQVQTEIVEKDSIYSVLIASGFYKCAQAYQYVPKSKWPAACHA